MIKSEVIDGVSTLMFDTFEEGKKLLEILAIAKQLTQYRYNLPEYELESEFIFRDRVTNKEYIVYCSKYVCSNLRYAQNTVNYMSPFSPPIVYDAHPLADWLGNSLNGSPPGLFNNYPVWIYHTTHMPEVLNFRQMGEARIALLNHMADIVWNYTQTLKVS